MKKLVVLILACTTFGLAQVNAQAIEKGNSLITLQVGLAGTFAVSGADTSISPTLTYEYAVMDQLTVGAFGSYASAEYEYPNYTWKWTYIFAGAVGNYHFVNTDKFDVYAGARLGFISVSFDDDGTGLPDPSSGGFGYVAQVGARYFFTPNIALNAEVGYGFTIARAGVTFQF